MDKSDAPEVCYYFAIDTCKTSILGVNRFFLESNPKEHNTHTVDVMMMRAKRFAFSIDYQSKQLVFFFPKRNRKHVLCVSIELQKRLWMLETDVQCACSTGFLFLTIFL